MTRVYYLKWADNEDKTHVYTAETMDDLLYILETYLKIDINEKEFVNYKIEVKEVPCEEENYEA